MDHTARLAVFEQTVKFSPAFKHIVQTLLEVVTKALESSATAEGREVPVNSIRELDDILKLQETVKYLRHVGFHVNNKTLTYPATLDVRNLEMSKVALERKLQILNGTGPKHGARRKTTVKLLPRPRVLKTDNEFLNSLESSYERVLKYEDEDLQAKARQCVPLVTLQTRAIDRMREQQKAIKKGSEETEGPFEVALLSELVTWFKETFFSWVDRPACSACRGQTTFMKNNLSKVNGETCRVEVFRCQSCAARTEFVRHNDPEQLLRTRAGRCGEWANCFTLILRAVGFDARYVVDTTDHVWCEIYDAYSRRWLHVDPCEAAINTPLMYENGWGKKLEYVIAYSRDDIQDVTWRYSSRHAEVRAHRNRCSESELIDTLMSLREERQRLLQVSKSRVKFLQHRLIAELVEMMFERQPGYYESQGRISGSEEWRQQRGESGTGHKYTWKLDKPGEHTLEYYPVRDVYARSLDRVEVETRLQWVEGAWKCDNVRRKVETDWKMVYLARVDGAAPGSISWLIEVADGLLIEGASIRHVSQCFNNASVDWTVCFDDGEFQPVTFENSTGPVSTDIVKSCRSLVVAATLKGSVGETAWQHAQLCRLPLDSVNAGLSITLNIVRSS